MVRRNTSEKTTIDKIHKTGIKWIRLQFTNPFGMTHQLSVNAEEITEEQIAAGLSLADLPEPDLFIRSGGEMRISNFLVWQLAYTELYFTDVLWPDFKREEFNKALKSFSSRQRRFGRTGEQVEAS